jgi:hypothetical protein
LATWRECWGHSFQGPRERVEGAESCVPEVPPKAVSPRCPPESCVPEVPPPESCVPEVPPPEMLLPLFSTPVRWTSKPPKRCA